MELNQEYLQRAKHMFGQERAGLIFAVDEYLDAKKAVDRSIERRFYERSIERRFFKAGEHYISKINESQNKSRNGKPMLTLDSSNNSVNVILQEILQLTAQLPPSHQLQMSKEFPELLGKKAIISSLSEAASNQPR